jgi:uncharacterized integral membrane protein (TIGR00697 family)
MVQSIDTKTTLGIVFATALVVANVTAAKLAFFQLPYVGGVAVPAGFVAIGVAFLASDLLSELYGPDAAHQVVNATVLALVVGYGLIYAAIWLPVAPFFEANAAYETTLGASATIVLASICTTLVSQHVDVRVFHWLREVTAARHKWLRNVGSTSVSQFVDTAVFILLGFAVFPLVFGGTTTPLAVLPELVVGQYVVKLVVAGLDTPVFYLVTAAADGDDVDGRDVVAD